MKDKPKFKTYVIDEYYDLLSIEDVGGIGGCLAHVEMEDVEACDKLVRQANLSQSLYDALDQCREYIELYMPTSSRAQELYSKASAALTQARELMG